MTRLRTFLRDERGAAAAEIALVLPLLLVLMFGSFELGNYFRDWHTLSKAVRDGARFAARHDFVDLPCGGTASAEVLDPTTEVVRTGLVGGSTDLLSNWNAAEVDMDVACVASVDISENASEAITGIYRNAEGAAVVTLTVRLPYRGILGQFGWSGAGLNIAASEQAAVTGI